MPGTQQIPLSDPPSIGPLSALAHSSQLLSRTSVVAERDLYERRAASYDGLAWVRAMGHMRRVLTASRLTTAPGLLDLGCGPAHVSALVAGQYRRAYAGIDRSAAMARIASSHCAHLADARVWCMDFLAQPVSSQFDGYVQLLKNVLHLVPNPLGLLQDQLPKWGRAPQLVVVETVSPSSRCRDWVRQVFGMIGSNHKRHLFTDTDLRDTIDRAGYRLTQRWLVEQHIDVAAWLDSFGITASERDGIVGFIAGTAPDIRRDMQIRYRDGRLHMLRLQATMLAEPPN